MLFSGEDNLGACLKNLKILRRRHICHQPLPKNIYVDVEANEDDDEDEEDDDASDNDGEQDQGLSAKDTLSKKIDKIYNNTTNISSSSRRLVSYRATWPPATLKSRMYLLHVYKTATTYIGEYLQSKGFTVTMSPWLSGQLYVISDSPRTIASSLPDSHKIGDHIEVLVGQHIGKQGIMTIPPHGGTDLWFQDESLQNFIAGATKYYLGPPIIQVPVATIWQMHLPQTIKFTREKGYDIKPGDVIEVAHSPEY
ncbi:uncharacterized protein BJ212DRAFT_1487621 [Suillus subaureus]|uniref:Uncharacterized protein n=1 Tax=Suillus subaureus TaxID=48587 RepID=A0A9P7DS25_9AGAM|nr:uncharacterized protein BJ212DRAFT_1487621 [Suillus subaureus]KAG1801728.1 hypothetical protein BJ212DRAFT_1487621 [Suillus subaureus]